MKRHEKESLRSMSSEELGKEVRALEAQMRSTKLERVTKPTKNVHALRLKRQNIAVSKTILRERELTPGS